MRKRDWKKEVERERERETERERWTERDGKRMNNCPSGWQGGVFRFSAVLDVLNLGLLQQGHRNPESTITECELRLPISLLHLH